MNQFSFIFILIFSFGLRSQVKVAIFSSGDSLNKDKNVSTVNIKAKPSLEKNLIKFDDGLLLRGIGMIDYERRVSRKFTIEIGLGASGRDFVFEQFVGSRVAMPLDYMSISTLSTNGTWGGAGLCFQISPRYYFDPDEFKGLFITPIFGYRNYKINIDENMLSGMQTFTNLGYSFMDVGAKIGYQFYIPIWENFYWEYSVGGCIRTATYRTLQENYSPLYQQTVAAYQAVNYTSSYIALLMTIKIGYSF